MSSSILEETHNFIRLYLHHAGDTEVPENFHLWSCLSLLAACLGNNVWFEKFPGNKLFPNLYVILLGPSGLGKGQAIGKVTGLSRDEPLISMYRGSATKASLIDMLSSPRKLAHEQDVEYLNGSRVYYVTPELGMSLGTGVLAADFVKYMTEMFTGDEGVHSEGTRMHGQKNVVNPILNWLGGSTADWLVQSVPPDAISGGFFARTIVVKQEYDLDFRKYKPLFPSDLEEVKKHLRARVRQYCRVRGQFTMTLAAERVDADWYEKRPAPDDEILIPIWKREHDLVYKIAMLVCMSDMLIWDGKARLVLTDDHMRAAQHLITSVRSNIKDTLAMAGTTQDTKNRTVVMHAIKSAGTLSRTQLLRKVSNKGVNGIILSAIVQDLRDENLIQITNVNNVVYYSWKKRMVM